MSHKVIAKLTPMGKERLSHCKYWSVCVGFLYTVMDREPVMEVGDIILLLEFCLKNTYFSFQGQFYEQVEGAAMGSPVSPIVANLSITVYRKPTHTDQYLQWDSHHHLSAKFSVIQTLSHRASTMCSNPELLQKEKEHLRKALTNCNYPKWALDKVEKRLNRPSQTGQWWGQQQCPVCQPWSAK